MKLLLLISMMMPLFAHGQFQQPTGEPLVKVEVLQAKDTTLSKAELYGRVIKWVATSFGSSKAVTDLSDATTGIVVVKPAISFKWSVNSFVKNEPATIRYSLQIETKQGKVRLRWSDYKYSNDATPTQYRILTDNKKPTFTKAYRNYMSKEWGAAHEAIELDWLTTMQELRSAINAESNW